MEDLEAAHEHLAQETNPKGVLECIDYLVNDLRVDLDAPNVNDYTALTYAAERRLHDVAAMLLAVGANVNHRFHGDGTALVCVIMKDVYEMSKLLLEYCADYRLFVDALGRAIYAMELSEKMRQLIPQRAWSSSQVRVPPLDEGVGHVSGSGLRSPDHLPKTRQIRQALVGSKYAL